MENIKKAFYLCLFTLCVISFGSCDDKDKYDVYGDPYNRVYVPFNVRSYKIIQTPLSTVNNLDFKTIVKCTQKASGNIRVVIEIDNTMIAAYNEEHGTNYKEVPKEALVIENGILNIPDGATISTDTIGIKLTDDAKILSGMKEENGYLIPVRIVSTEGGNSKPSSNLYYNFLTISVTEDNVNHGATENDITGTLVKDQTGWSATTNGTVQVWNEPLSTLFDDDATTYCNVSNSEDLNLDINMGKPYVFDAITFYYKYDWGGNYGSLSGDMSVYTSNDGISWQLVGRISNDAAFCVFYAPVTAQYVRLTKPKSGYSTSVMAGVFNIYTKK